MTVSEWTATQNDWIPRVFIFTAGVTVVVVLRADGKYGRQFSDSSGRA